MSRSQDLLIALNDAPGLPRAAACRLAAELDRWWPRGSDPKRLGPALGVPARSMAAALTAAADAGRAADRERRRAEGAGARLLTRLDPDYPPRLLHLALPPPVLAVRGRLPPAPGIAIVGSRRATHYGREAAELFGRGLASAGVVVVSGFARGVDAAAHRGAIAAGGATVAVLGCGIDVDYPRGHGRLAAAVEGAGGLISELPCGTEPRAWNFPVRNRIIAALSLITLVVQATPRSGSLITARLALELGRDVFAVPGPIFDERSLGPNALLADGAGVARHPRDLLEALPMEARDELARRHGGTDAGAVAGGGEGADGGDGDGKNDGGETTLPGLPGRVLSALPRGEPQAPERLAEAAGTTVDRVLAALLELELGGWVRRFPGPLYGRAL